MNSLSSFELTTSNSFKKENNESYFSKNNLLKQKEDKRLTLRKESISDLIKAKRFVNIDSLEKNYCIDINSVELKSYKEEITKITEELNLKDIMTMLKYLEENKQSTDLIKFYLYHLKLYLKKQPNTQDNKYEKVTYVLCLLLKSFINDKVIIYEVLGLLTNLISEIMSINKIKIIIYCDKTFKIFSLILDHYSNINRISNKVDKVIIEQFLFLLGNISGEGNDQFNTYLFNNKIHLLCLNLINSLSTNDTKVTKPCIWIISNILNNLTEDKTNSLNEHSNLFINTLNRLFTNNEDVITYLVDCLKILYRLTYYGSKVYINAIIESELLSNIFEISLEEDEDMFPSKLIACRLIGNLLMGELVEIKKLIRLGVIETIKNVLLKVNISEENSQKIAKELIWSISNICTETMELINYLEDQGIFIIIIKIALLGFNQSKSLLMTSILRECLYSLGNAILGSTTEVQFNLVKYGIVDIFLLGIREFCNKDFQLIKLVLKSINMLSRLEDNAMIDGSLDIKNTIINDKIYDELSDFMHEAKNEEVVLMCEKVLNEIKF